MAKVVKTIRTLRNHWKKSTFAVGVLSYGGHWLYGKYCDNQLRREACLKAMEFGRQSIAPQDTLKKATVILNPKACSGKANSLYEKNAAPILHLAGMEVKLVKTDYEGQAKKLMELMDNTDMLIVAGGDGTLQEVVTGMLRRADQESFSKTPIGFIPLGSSHNSLSWSLNPPTDNVVKHITTATLSILKGATVPLDVLQIKGEKEQPVFALIGLRWGPFRDVAATINKYWYLGPLKEKAAHWFSSLKEWPQVRQASLAYLGPVPRPPEPIEKAPRAPLLTRIIRRFKLYWNPPAQEIPKEEPTLWKEKDVSTLELSIITMNKNPALKREEDSLLVCVEPDSLTVGEFISFGSKKVADPSVCSDKVQNLEATVCRLRLPEEGAGFYNIDHEEYEAMSVEVSLLPRKLRFFCSAERMEQLLSDTP